MTRLALLGVVVLAGCAAKREAPSTATGAAPAQQDTAGAVPPTAPPVQGAASAPAETPGPVNAKEAARSSGHLGPTTNAKLFEPLLDDGAKPRKDAPPKPTDAGPKTRGGGGPKAGPSAGVDAADVGGKIAQPGGGAGTSLGVPVLSNSADPTFVRTALAKHAADIGKCYAAARTKKPNLAGQFTLVFTVQPDGTLDAVSATKSTVKDDGLESCVVNIVKTTKLDTPLATTAVKGSVDVTFTAISP